LAQGILARLVGLSLQRFMGTLTTPVAFVAEDAFSEAHVESLKAFIDECPYPPSPPDVLTEEYWVSVEAVKQPCNPVEEIIAHLLQRPDVAAVIGKVAGAEWSWHDYLDTDEPKVYHTDCNRRLVDDRTTITNPQWSSVVYLTDEGGATAIWRDNEFVVVQPRRGRYLLFQGDLAHGVLHAQDPKHKDRIVLSITWWCVSSDATGVRERPPATLLGQPWLADPEIGRKDVAEEEAFESADPRILKALVPVPISVAFSAHKEEWYAQRMPADLKVAHKAGAPPAHVAVRYINSEVADDWWRR